MLTNISNISWFIVYFDNLGKDFSNLEKDYSTTMAYLGNFISYIDDLKDKDVKPSHDEADKMLGLLLMLLSELAKSNQAAYYMLAWSTAVGLYKLNPYLSDGGRDVMKSEIVKLHNTYRQAFQVLLDSRIASDSLSNLNLYEPRYIPIGNVAMAYGAIASLLIQFVS